MACISDRVVAQDAAARLSVWACKFIAPGVADRRALHGDTGRRHEVALAMAKGRDRVLTRA